MISGMRFLNFQGFLGDQRVPLGQITTLFGPNSSGKSSVGRGLRILSQSLENYRQGMFVVPDWESSGGSSDRSLVFGKQLGSKLPMGVGIKIPFSVGPYSEVWFSLVSTEFQSNEFEFTSPEHSAGEGFTLGFKMADYLTVEYRDEDAVEVRHLLKELTEPLSFLMPPPTEGLVFTTAQASLNNYYPQLTQLLLERLGQEFFEALDLAETTTDIGGDDEAPLDSFREPFKALLADLL